MVWRTNQTMFFFFILPCLFAGFAWEAAPYFGIIVTGYGFTGISISSVSLNFSASSSSPDSRSQIILVAKFVIGWQHV